MVSWETVVRVTIRFVIEVLVFTWNSTFYFKEKFNSN
jgi:hypothetical protein